MTSTLSHMAGLDFLGKK